MFPFIKRWQLFPPWKQAAVASSFLSLKQVFDLESEILSKSKQSEIFAYEIEGKHFFVKRYFQTKGWISWFGYSRFEREVRNQRWFNKVGIPSAKVVAYGEDKLLFKTLKGVLITERIPHVRDLAGIARNNPEQFQNRAWCSIIIKQLAEITFKLHFHRFCHNDMHWRNILIQQENDLTVPKVFLIDCPSGKKLVWPLLHYRKMKDLANLDKLAAKYLSKTQRLRFLLLYRNSSKLSTADKKVVREVMQHKVNRLKRKTKVCQLQLK